MAAEVSKFTGNADGFSESVQNKTGWLHLSKPCELETICENWEETCLGVARCLGDPRASGMVWTGADGSLWRRMVPFGVESWSRRRKLVPASKMGARERFVTPLFVSS